MILWGTKQAELLNKVNLPYVANFDDTVPKHFKGTKSINFSNTIVNKAYHFNVGSNGNSEFLELSFHSGFVVIVDKLKLNYCDSIVELVKKTEESNFIFNNDGQGNYTCDQLGITLSESAYPKNQFGKGMLECIYITKPMPADSKVSYVKPQL